MEYRANRLSEMLRRSPMLVDSQITVRIDGHIVEVTGAVATARQVRLVEQMLRMEPGVRHVVNRLRYQESLPQNTRTPSPEMSNSMPNVFLADQFDTEPPVPAPVFESQGVELPAPEFPPLPKH